MVCTNGGTQMGPLDKDIGAALQVLSLAQG